MEALLDKYAKWVHYDLKLGNKGHFDRKPYRNSNGKMVKPAIENSIFGFVCFSPVYTQSSTEKRFIRSLRWGRIKRMDDRVDGSGKKYGRKRPIISKWYKPYELKIKKAHELNFHVWANGKKIREFNQQVIRLNQAQEFCLEKLENIKSILFKKEMGWIYELDADPSQREKLYPRPVIPRGEARRSAMTSRKERRSDDQDFIEIFNEDDMNLDRLIED